jgi:hypothetical protein
MLADGFVLTSDVEWAYRRAVLLRQAATVVVDDFKVQQECAAYFQANFEPSLSCASEQRIGKAGDGGKCGCATLIASVSFTLPMQRALWLALAATMTLVLKRPFTLNLGRQIFTQGGRQK